MSPCPLAERRGRGRQAAKAEAARLEGNDAMRQRSYGAAFDCYTIALQHMPRDHLVLANRSQAGLKLGHFSLVRLTPSPERAGASSLSHLSRAPLLPPSPGGG